MNAKSTAFRTQKGSWPEVLCWLAAPPPLLCLLGAGALLFPFLSPVPARDVALKCLVICLPACVMHAQTTARQPMIGAQTS